MVNLAPFGDIDPEDLDDQYHGIVDYQDRDIDVVLHFESSQIEFDDLEFIESMLFDLDSKIENAYNAIADDFDQGDDSEVTQLFLNHHFDELLDAEKQDLFATLEPEAVDQPTFVSLLEVTRINLYPEDLDQFMAFELQFPQPFNRQRIIVSFSRDGYLAQLITQS